MKGVFRILNKEETVISSLISKLRYAKTVCKKYAENKNVMSTVVSLTVAVTFAGMSVFDVFGAGEINEVKTQKTCEDTSLSETEEVIEISARFASQPIEYVIEDAYDEIEEGWSVYVDGVLAGKVSDRGRDKIEEHLNELVESAVTKKISSASLAQTVEFEKGIFNSADIDSSNTVLSQMNVTVKTVAVKKATKELAFETVYKDSDKVAKGKTVVETEGENGSVTYEYEITYVNGEEVSRETVSKTVVEPVNKVVLNGTKQVASYIEPVDGLAFPVGNASYYVSSEFGYRSFDSSFHNGIDYACDMGTPVYSAMGGKVVFAGWDDTGYGNYVVVEHENGYTTGYAHLSTISVNVGDTVIAGAALGGVGSTGYSTGNHLHFSVKVNGQYLDPALLF